MTLLANEEFGSYVVDEFNVAVAVPVNIEPLVDPTPVVDPAPVADTVIVLRLGYSVE